MPKENGLRNNRSLPNHQAQVAALLLTIYFTDWKYGQWFIVSYDSANKQKHHKSHRMQ